MARVRVGHREYWFGRWGDPESHSRYAEFIVDYLQRRGTGPDSSTSAFRESGSAVSPESAPEPEIQRETATTEVIDVPHALTVAELCARYLDFAEQHYALPDGRKSTTFGNVRMGIRALAPYDHLPAERFGPLMLTKIMHSMVGQPTRRKRRDGKPPLNTLSSINATIKQVRRIFRWAVNQELIPSPVWQALSAVELLRKGRTAAVERTPRKPVPDEVIERTLPHLPRIIADMVRTQRRIGCRPGELCRMLPGDIDRSGDVWVWRLREHKTAWRGEEREIAIGPLAQAILIGYLDRPSDVPCFLPSESEAERNTLRRATRKTPMTPIARVRQRMSQGRRQSTKPYGEKAYCRAITRACEKHGIPRWTPHQLRHAAADEIRFKEDLDAAQAVLGHKHAKVTEVYAQVRLEKKMAIARKYG